MCRYKQKLEKDELKEKYQYYSFKNKTVAKFYLSFLFLQDNKSSIEFYVIILLKTFDKAYFISLFFYTYSLCSIIVYQV